VPAETEYHERLGVPLRWWVQGTMLVASLWLAVVVATPGPVAYAVTAVAMLLLGAGLMSYGGVRVTVADGVFRAGRAHIEGRHLGAVEALDAEQTRRTAGPEADVRAYLVLRPYLKRAVKVEITDPQDPTPYWLVSSRRPDDLASALRVLTGRTPGG
jgi:DUF3093 family protein